jgi:F0F1-type ATP synthase delta subunit
MSLAAQGYAKALLDFTYPSNAQMGRVQLRSFLLMLSNQEGVRLMLENPSLSIVDRMELLDHIAGALHMDPPIRSFLGLLIDRNGLGFLEEIVDLYENLLAEKLEEARAAAGSQPESTRPEDLTARLHALTGR